MKATSAQDLIRALQKLGMTDAEIAAKAKVSQPTITRLRNGYYKNARHDTWLKVNEAFLHIQADRVLGTKERVA